MHSIERTNPKGEPFIGICVLCNEPNLSFEDVIKDCPNPKKVTKNEAIINAIIIRNNRCH